MKSIRTFAFLGAVLITAILFGAIAYGLTIPQPIPAASEATAP